MASGVLMISLLTASFSSSLTVANLRGKINGPADLTGHEVATVHGSTAEAWLKARQIKVRAYPSAREAIMAVESQEVDGAVYDEPILRYELAKYPDTKLHLAGQMFEEQAYGFGLQLKSPYQKQINQVLLELMENKTVEELKKKWFGEAAPGKAGGAN
jgi:ABC-type amino acid transport substrate-binding protein